MIPLCSSKPSQPFLSNFVCSPLNPSCPSDILISTSGHPGHSRKYEHLQFCHLQLHILSFCKWHSVVMISLPSWKPSLSSFCAFFHESLLTLVSALNVHIMYIATWSDRLMLCSVLYSFALKYIKTLSHCGGYLASFTKQRTAIYTFN